MPYTQLVSPKILADHINDPDWIVFDVRHELQNPSAGREAYLAGHVPGARFLHMDEDLAAPLTGRNGRHPLPDREGFARRMAALGVRKTSQVVVYDAAGGMMAARLWWMFRWIGHGCVAVLDGAWQGWAKEGAISTERPAPPENGDLELAPPLTRQVDSDYVLANLTTRNELVVDARGADRFRGENETMDPVGGHIPGARNRCFRDNLTPQGEFKDADSLRQELLEVFGEYRPDQVIAQCGSGVTACHNLLAMEIAGLAGAALYPGSWSEWCSDPQRPVAR